MNVEELHYEEYSRDEKTLYTVSQLLNIQLHYYNEAAVSIHQIYLNKYTVILDNYRYVELVNDIIID